MVDAELFARYQQALTTVADLSKDAVQRLVNQLEGMDEGQRAVFLLTNYPKLVREYGLVSADVARQFYQKQRDGSAQVGDYVAQSAQVIPEQWAMEDVSDAMTGSHGMTIVNLPGKASKRVLQRADETITQNAYRDSRRPYWAIVPNAGACAFCVMVGSRGFVYHSGATADAQRHLNCRCTPVCDFDTENPHLDGYDPAALYDQYLGDLAEGIVTTRGSSIGSIGLRSAADGGTQTVSALPSKGNWSGNLAKAQLAANMTTMQHYLNGSKTIDELKKRMDECNRFLTSSGMGKAMSKGQRQSLQKCLSATKEAIEQRGRAFAAIDADKKADDREKSKRKARFVSIREESLLFYDSNGNRSIPLDPGGGSRKPDYCCMSGKQRRDLKGYEVEGHGILARLGFDVVPIPTDYGAVASIDLWMDGQFWELKTSQGSGGRLTTRINQGVKKWDNLHNAGYQLYDTPRIVVDNRFSAENDADALRKLKTAMAVHGSERFDDAIFIASTGKVTRLRA